MADGCEFEVFPAGLVMQPESSAYQLKLMGVPQQPGCLTIHGQYPSRAQHSKHKILNL